MHRPASRSDFRVAIICALTLEADYVRALFDQHWDSDGTVYGKAQDDPNAYSIGSIGRHNVVLAHMPGMGKTHAAATAAGCRMSFPNLDIALVVGICGVVPFPQGGQEIVLGDVIISEGLVQYDLGRRLPGRFKRKTAVLESLGRPNLEIRALIAKLKGVQTRATFQTTAKTYMGALSAQELSVEYPGSEHDRLFEATFEHGLEGMSCEECGCDGSLVPRTRLDRPSPEPTIHFGLVASGDTVMKSGTERDYLAQREGTLAYEMEGSGISDIIPCVVIKGACDYADSHKSKVWQPYAAATAASCMKAFLGYWKPSIESNGLAVKDDALDPRKARIAKLTKKLYPYMTKYVEQKDRNPERVQGTCEWFINHPLYQHWRETKESALLWVSADPGCGKSVLAKYLVDHIMPLTGTTTTCYYFFKDDFEDQNKAVGALCCILHQLFRQRPDLLTNSILERLEDGDEEALKNFLNLWKILTEVTRHENIGQIICVIDALDECEHGGQEQLMKALNTHFGTGQRRSSLKVIITSRPYDQFRRGFFKLEKDQPTIHLSGENGIEADNISKEVNVYCRQKVEELSMMLELPSDGKDMLLRELMSVENRTYLWVSLVFSVIEADRVMLTGGDLRKNIRRLPKTVEEAYESILAKIRDSEKAKKLLHIIVAAERALSVQEMAVALSFSSPGARNASQGEILSDHLLERSIRETCALFVTIKDSKVYLIHQTAREFLVRLSSSDSFVLVYPSSMGSNRLGDIQSSVTWKHSLCELESNRVLAEICMRYLLSSRSEKAKFEPRSGLSEHQGILFDYSACYWAMHFRRCSSISTSTMVGSALLLCDSRARFFKSWFAKYWQSLGTTCSPPTGLNTVMTASYFGLEPVVSFALEHQKANEDSLYVQDLDRRRSALAWASANGHNSVVRSLLHQIPWYRVRLANWSSRFSTILDQKDMDGRTPLFLAAKNGHTAVVESLARKGAKLDTCDEYGQTAISWASYNSDATMAKLLARMGAKQENQTKPINTRDYSLLAPLHSAVLAHEDEPTVYFLLEHGADVNAKDHQGNTALHCAAKVATPKIILLLIEKGAKIESMDPNGLTPLHIAVARNSQGNIQVLLENGADVEAETEQGDRPLHLAARSGSVHSVRLLLEYGADMEWRGSEEDTPLETALILKRSEIATVLIEKGANVNRKDLQGFPPLHAALSYFYDIDMIRLLLDRGADMNGKNSQGSTPLHFAAGTGKFKSVQLLIDKGAEVNARNNHDETPLHRAAQNKNIEAATLLLKAGANIRVKGHRGRTPLHYVTGATLYNWSNYGVDTSDQEMLGMTQLLIDNGADIHARDDDGQTPLYGAALCSDMSLSQLLINEGATLDDSNSADRMLQEVFKF